MSPLFDTPVSLTSARTGKRLRLRALPIGAALVPVVQPEPILGYTYRRGHLTVYVAGPMPAAMRTAVEEGHDEVLLVPALPAGIREIDLTDNRHEYQLLLPEAA
jgi:hypothetical protein